uniref:Uncharacterized protein n=1 Tax=Strigamia maritima TaxID=126957 RepID=T1IHA4_STRMM
FVLNSEKPSLSLSLKIQFQNLFGKPEVASTINTCELRPFKMKILMCFMVLVVSINLADVSVVDVLTTTINGMGKTFSAASEDTSKGITNFVGGNKDADQKESLKEKIKPEK